MMYTNHEHTTPADTDPEKKLSQPPNRSTVILNYIWGASRSYGAVSLIVQPHQLQRFLNALLDFGFRTSIEEAGPEAQHFTCSHVLVKAWILGQVADLPAHSQAITDDVAAAHRPTTRGWTYQA
jgi:hypothetical protein